MYICSSNTINLNFMVFFWNYVGLMVVMVFILVHSWGVHIVSKCFEDAITNNCSIFRRALFCRSCMKSQIASPLFPGVFHTFVAVVNRKFQKIGYFLLIIVPLHLGMDFKHNDKVGLSLSFKLLFTLVNSFLYLSRFLHGHPYILFNCHATSLTASNNNHSSSHNPRSFTWDHWFGTYCFVGHAFRQ